MDKSDVIELMRNNYLHPVLNIYQDYVLAGHLIFGKFE